MGAGGAVKHPLALPALEIRSSWLVEDGWARPIGSPKQHDTPHVALPLHIATRHVRHADKSMTMARIELARRIDERKRGGKP